MTREEVIAELETRYLTMSQCANKAECRRANEALDEAIKALEQDLNMEQFAKWVATELFDDDWKYNRYVFAEIACRKLAELGIVRKNGGTWELVEPQESEGEE